MSYDIYFHVEGVKPSDERFAKMINTAKNLMELNLDVQPEILNYLNVDDESEIDFTSNGVVVDITDTSFVEHSESENGDIEYFTVDVSRIPKDFKNIRFKIRHSY